jgi:ABC-type Mn2+/Zn2+ transport system ATPase subunit
MSDGEVLIEARDLTLAYHGRAVLRGASFRVGLGQFWCVLGPNGAGKSTLLRAILGLERPVGGSLWRHPTRARGDQLSFVPQRCDLNPALPTTVREFVLLGTVGLTLPRPEETERLTWALERVGLHGGARRDYWTLSGGERQRALLARGLVRRPSVLLLDEPTTHLDRKNARLLLDLLAALATEGRLVPLLVTHDEAIAARYASHVAILGDGTLTAGERAVMLA